MPLQYTGRMLSQRWRPVLISALAVAGIWCITVVAYSFAKSSKMTAEKVKAYAESVDLSKLSGDERARALRKLEQMLNALSADERQRSRLERTSFRWLEQMTEEEKGSFIEATMPTGFKQMINAFEQLPEEKRARAINDAMRRLRDAQLRIQAGLGEDGNSNGTNLPPVLSPELQARIRTIGLRTFYSQSSAQTKAEVAPVLEELQRIMESGRPFHER
jgi:hypothetical protein